MPDWWVCACVLDGWQNIISCLEKGFEKQLAVRHLILDDHTVCSVFALHMGKRGLPHSKNIIMTWLRALKQVSKYSFATKENQMEHRPTSNIFGRRSILLSKVLELEMSFRICLEDSQVTKKKKKKTTWRSLCQTFVFNVALRDLKGKALSWFPC